MRDCRLHAGLWSIVGFMLLSSSACSPGGHRNTATGTVRFLDGSSLNEGQIHFEATAIPHRFSADIRRGGKFVVDWRETETPPGEYLVLIIARNASGESLVAEEFTTAETTPLRATIRAGTNRFEFLIEEPAEKSVEEPVEGR